MTRLKDAIDFTWALLQSRPAALTSVGGLTPAADKAPYYTGTTTAALMTVTSFLRTLLDDADAATARATLGLGAFATLASTDRGLIAKCNNSSAQTVNSGATDVINFDNVEYDPLSTITTGASWHFTAPATGWYTIVLAAAFIDPNGSAYSAATGVEFDLYKNTSTFLDTIAYEESDGTAATNHWLFLVGTVTESLTSGNTLTGKLNNFSGAARKFGGGGVIEIHRAA